MDTIQVRGARTHNLKNIDLDIPRDKLIVITGLSGSGKSSLAFDTLYAEGQRRYVESLSTYARQFLSMMEKPDVDHVEGLSPAISIEQKSTSHNPRSTVGTITEIYDYLRLLFARAGEPRCPEHGQPLNAQTVSQMVDQIIALPEGTKLMLLAPVIKDRKGEHLHLFESLRRQGFIRARIDGLVCDLDEAPALDKKKKHTIEVVVDRFKVKADIGLRLAESLETALALAEGLVSISYMGDEKLPDQIFSAKFACPICNYSLNELEPRLFSFNNPAGACPTCDGLGVHQFFDIDRVIQHPEASISEGAIRGWDRRTLFYYNMLTSLAEHYNFDIEAPWEKLSQIHQQKILFGSGTEEITFNYVNDRGTVFRREHSFEGVINNMERRYRETESTSVREELTKYMASSSCPECSGTRLRKSARNVFIDNKRIEDIVCMPVGECSEYFENLDLPGRQGEIAEKIVKEIRQRFNFLVDVGLNYLSLNRSADTLSGGEAQRIRLASQIGAGLVGVMYILDEPSIGLHQRDNERLLKTLVRLRDLGNTVIVVEHDEDAIASADHVIDIGPGAGIHGGEVVAEGTIKQIKANKNSITGQFLSGKRGIKIPKVRNKGNGKTLKIVGATGNNLQKINLDIPLGVFTCITGVSGSGKSTLINGTLYPAAAIALNKASTLKPAAHTKISGLSHLDKCIDINQSPIGRTPRSNPATYTGIFTPVREIFAGTQEARSRGYNPGRFSFNVKGGRCEACQGDGVTKVEMHFLPDIYVPCDVCKGKRYNRETLDIHFKGKNIHQVLAMTIEDAREFFDAIPAIARKLQTLIDVGLSYISLGQSATTLSGGEAQRVKLSKELSKRDTGKTLYILDEPTTGLHFHDIEQLMAVLHRLRDHGNTVVVIEHNLDVIKTADWVVDLGPEGGSGGGQIIAKGTPEEVALVEGSHTGFFLKDILKRKR
ncbi:excinuclease ABC subunit UvrA [Porticoccaceae bacterium]|jgi:excinuclease ABC subunit A|nr:excinuclease ABC subunit UvrA [Porticoccaceae bacterium]|tara:strand:+ start:14077 stop:16908 length:2832 start_codon:yes stop_codon:yes gene_type:complete